MSGFLETFQKANQSGVDFLLADLDLALTFMNVAQVCSNPETVIRNRYHAHKAYDTALGLLKKLRLDAEQQQAMDAKLALVKTRLKVDDRRARLSGPGTLPGTVR